MAKKQKKSDEQLRKEFFEREAKEYGKRVKPVVIAPEVLEVKKTDKTQVVEETDEIEETEETTENEETEETKGE